VAFRATAHHPKPNSPTTPSLPGTTINGPIRPVLIPTALVQSNPNYYLTPKSQFSSAILPPPTGYFLYNPSLCPPFYPYLFQSTPDHPKPKLCLSPGYYLYEVNPLFSYPLSTTLIFLKLNPPTNPNRVISTLATPVQRPP
jgi:hypothetical protein